MSRRRSSTKRGSAAGRRLAAGSDRQQSGGRRSQRPVAARSRQPSGSAQNGPDAPFGPRRQRPGRTLLVLFFASGIAGLGLLSGGEHPTADAVAGRDPMTGYYSSAMPRYPHAKEAPAGPDTRIGGARTRMSHFVTQDDPGKVAAFYERQWRARGMWIKQDITHKGGYVSAVDPSGGRVYQILLSAEGSGQTKVYPSSTDAPLKALENRDDVVPVQLFEGSEVLMNLQTRAGPHTARTVLSVNYGTLDENLNHYRAVLAARGYSEDLSNSKLGDQADTEGAPHMLVYRNGHGAELTVTLSRLDGDRTRVHMMQIGE
jgi:hypothetical protein